MGDAGYDALWDAIASSPFGTTYIGELHSLAAEVAALADDVFAAAPKPKTADDFLKVDHALMRKLFTLLGVAARISAMLTERPRRKDQSARDHEVLKRRARWLRDEVLRGVKLERIFEAKVRHTLEHFDEYIDETAIKYATRRLPTPSLAPVDMVVSRRRTLQRFAIQQKVPHCYFMRVYIAAERTFVNCEREISIQALRDECRRIAKRLTPYVPEPDAKPDARGSSILVIADNTFPRTP